MNSPAYQPKRALRSEFLTLNGLKMHLNCWGMPDKPLILMVHGWMDVGASFQFVVDALQGDYYVVAPDWRGFGLTDWPVANTPGLHSYWFADYLADLDALVDHLSPHAPIALVGHSMGGNIALLYSGIRPQRVARLVNLEGFGMPDTPPGKAPGKYAAWLDALKQPQGLRSYPSLDAVAQRLIKTNYRLSPEKAAFLAQHWSKPVDDGYVILGDAAHKIPSPIGYRLAEAQACWAQVTAPVLHVEAAQTEAGLWLSQAGQPVDFAQFRTRFDCIANWACEVIDPAGHMLHHDQPEAVAKLIERHCF